MFDRIAPRYDLLNRLLSAGVDVRWRREAAKLLDPPSGSRILDVCTGTADLLGEVLRRDPAASGLGVDLSTEMLRRGLAKLKGWGMSDRAGVASGDAERLPLREASVDGVLIAFGIRNVSDPGAALKEMARVLRPGGRLVVLEFSMPRGWLGTLYRFYFGSVLPRIGGLVSGDPAAYAYLPASVARFPPPREFGQLMERSGFEGVRLRPLTGGVAHLYRGDKPRAA